VASAMSFESLSTRTFFGGSFAANLFSFALVVPASAVAAANRTRPRPRLNAILIMASSEFCLRLKRGQDATLMFTVVEDRGCLER